MNMRRLLVVVVCLGLAIVNPARAIARSAQTPSTATGGPKVIFSHPNNTPAVADRGAGIAALPPLQGVAAIAAGFSHTCALTTAGGVKCWGGGGQLGDGTTIGRSTPVDVIGLSNGVTAIAAGSFHTCALTTDGGVKCWGNNSYGQLGDGTTTNRSTPVNVVRLESRVAAIAAGSFHTCALTTTGFVKCWGDNWHGQLGDGTIMNTRPVPVYVEGLYSRVAAIAAGGSHTCALTTDRGVKCWGANYFGQLGSGTSWRGYPVPVPLDVVGLSANVTSLTAGRFHTCALTAPGGVKCWGRNEFGQLGDGTTTERDVPVDVLGLYPEATAVTAGENHTCAITAEGGTKCWGHNNLGQLGNGTTTNYSTPVDVINLSSGTASVAAGGDHTCAVTVDGKVKCWGWNGQGQLGDSTNTIRFKKPVNATGLGEGAAAITTGAHHTCAITSDGTAKCWGANERGQLGEGTTTARSVPVDVLGLAGRVAAVTGGGDHTCALTIDGGVKCWGDNWYGQLGDGTYTQRSTPFDVVGLTNSVSAISASLGWHTCALTTAGGTKCWGNNSFGQLGDGSGTHRTTPVDVVGLSQGVAAISAGKYHTCALTSAGGVKCWGYNWMGQLGNGMEEYNRYEPVDVIGLSGGTTAIAAGGYHTCALTTNGGVKCWGGNQRGQLGDGTTMNRNIPVNVVGLGNDVSAITAGELHTCALTRTGGVKCWGSHGYTQANDGTTADSTVPIDVIELASGVTSIVAGGSHTCALTTASEVKCWGWNGYGQLGLGTPSYRTIPVDVVTPLLVRLPLMLRNP